MKMICQAIRAVTVEFCGVALVVWLLVGGGSLGYRAVGGGHSELPVTVSSQAPGPMFSTVMEARLSDRAAFGHSYILASSK